MDLHSRVCVSRMRRIQDVAHGVRRGRAVNQGKVCDYDDLQIIRLDSLTLDAVDAGAE
jgi:hypothetical protein